MTRALLFFISLSAFTACSPSYTCGDIPDAVCQSVSETFEQTQDRVSSTSRVAARPDQTGSGFVASPGTDPLAHDPGFDDPFLTKPLLLRILFTPWQDKEHDLHAGGYVYIRLEDSKWVLPR